MIGGEERGAGAKTANNLGRRSFSEEGFESLAGVGGVGDATRLASRVHTQERGTDVDATDVDLRREDVAESRAAGHVATVDKALVGDARLLADCGEDSATVAVGHVFLRSVDLYDRAAVEHWVEDRVVQFRVVGVQGVSRVGRDEERVVEHTLTILGIEAEVFRQALQDVEKPRPA